MNVSCEMTLQAVCLKSVVTCKLSRWAAVVFASIAYFPWVHSIFLAIYNENEKQLTYWNLGVWRVSVSICLSSRLVTEVNTAATQSNCSTLQTSRSFFRVPSCQIFTLFLRYLVTEMFDSNEETLEVSLLCVVINYVAIFIASLCERYTPVTWWRLVVIRKQSVW